MPRDQVPYDLRYVWGRGGLGVTIVERFGRNVAAARMFRHMKQRDLAKALGHDPSYVSLIESGEREVGIALAEKIAVALGVHLAPLLTGEPFVVEPSPASGRKEQT
jgi:transcriptional regulator with XRE-family HTH domain